MVVELASSTIMMIVLSGTNLALLLLFYCITKSSPDNENKIEDGAAGGDEAGLELVKGGGDSNNKRALTPAVKGGAVAKKLSKPFTGTLDCFNNLTGDLLRISIIMAMTYICERHWFFEHSGKEYSREWFLFILALFFAYAIYTIKPIHDLSLLGREQTEEWKGWMQFIFLLYHYFHAEEVYNSVRVMITCYVWMTGFGNFSFFYIKRDFSWLRLVQMMWRLNFTVVLLMWTHANTWILYYICPMHTFYFLMVYATMFVWHSTNHGKWAVRVKLMVLGVIIYLVWDINRGMFDFLFAWLGTDQVIGANSGSVYEYYFRTSLDHWSSYFGMIFAANFPLAEQFFIRGKGAPVYMTAAVLGALTIYWFFAYYCKAKFDYNLTHSYTAVVPLTAYIFFRNITPWVRGFVSMSLHDLGKTTLETYLLQHHIWLTSNAKTLLTIVPNWPKLNFFIATAVFFIVSKELYRLTMTLRGMMLPDDPRVAWTNMVGMSVMIGIYYLATNLLVGLGLSSWGGIVILTCALTCLCIFVIRAMKVEVTEHPSFAVFSSRAVLVLAMLAVCACLVARYMAAATDGGTNAAGGGLSASTGTLGAAIGTPLQGWEMAQGLAGVSTNVPRECLEGLSSGSWGGNDQWQWTPAGAEAEHCHLHTHSAAEMSSLFRDKKVIFVGDSMVRNTFHAFIKTIEPGYTRHLTINKHEDMIYHVNGSGTTVSFKWSPYVREVANVVQTINKKNGEEEAHLVVLGGGLWDALWRGSDTDFTDLTEYKQGVQRLAQALQWSATGLTGKESALVNMGVILEPSTSTSTSTSISTNSVSAGDLKARLQEVVVRLQSFFKTDTAATAVPFPEATAAVVPVSVFLLPTTVVDVNLDTNRKKERMTEGIVRRYREESARELQGSGVNAIIDPARDVTSVKSGRAIYCSDGVHYGDAEYGVISQMVANAYALHNPTQSNNHNHHHHRLLASAPKARYTPRKTGSMSMPDYGAAVLLVSFIMILFLDNWLGVGVLALAITGRAYDWQAAYAPLLKSIGMGPVAATVSADERDQEEGLLAAGAASDERPSSRSGSRDGD
jgi:hypothetical protein